MRRALLLTLTLLTASALRAEEISVVVNGQYRDPVNAYKVGEKYYLAAKEAGQLYGGQVYWYPVSGRVQFSVRGRALQFVVGSSQVQVGPAMVTMDSAVLLRASQAFVPVTFFEGEPFSDWVGYDSSFSGRTRLLTVDRRATVGEVRWFSYKDYTRLSLELSPRVQFSASARGLGGVEVTFPLGTIAGGERAEIDDGVVSYYSLTQSAKTAKLALKFSKPGLQWQAKSLKNPRRLVVDVFKAGVVPTEEEAAAPARTTAAAKPSAAPSAPAAAVSTPAAAAASIGPVIVKSERARRKIVIDAGHGGKDPGATGTRGTEEKDINLKAALDLAKLLKEEGTFDVMLTRGDDTFVPLSDRSRLANDFGADLFVSLHCNASPHKRDNGFEVYFLSEKATDPAAQQLADFENSVVELEGKSKQDVDAELLLMEMSKTENVNAGSELAGLMARELQRRLDIADNGVKQAGFYVLRGTHAPAVLFEMAYLTNKRDEAKLESAKYRRRLVDGVYAGILDYAKRQGWLTGAGK